MLLLVLSSVPLLLSRVLQGTIGLSGYAGLMEILFPPMGLPCSLIKGGPFPGLPLAQHHVIFLHILFCLLLLIIINIVTCKVIC